MDEFLAIYLRDQLALSVMWRELARRAAHNNRDTELGNALDEVATAIAEDVATSRTIMDRVGVAPNPAKNLLAMGAERLGRLKLNGRLASNSPLSRFAELEFLTMGIDGKKQLWTTLRDLADLGTRLPDIDFDHLIERAEQQRSALERFRVEAGAEVFRAPSATNVGSAGSPERAVNGPRVASSSVGRRPRR